MTNTNKSWVDSTVNFGTTPPTCGAEIDVSEAKDKGIRWIADRAGFTLTNVDVYESDGTTPASGPGKEFWNVQTGTMASPSNPAVTVSFMTIRDRVDTRKDYVYTGTYTNDSNNSTGTFDPGIKNKD